MNEKFIYKFFNVFVCVKGFVFYNFCILVLYYFFMRVEIFFYFSYIRYIYEILVLGKFSYYFYILVLF